MAIAVWTSFKQLMDDSGNLLAGGTVTVQAAGTSTPLSCFSDEALTISATNPIPLNSAGRHTVGIVYIATQKYKTLVKNSAAVTITNWTRDNIDPGVPIGTGVLPIANGGTGAATGPAALTNLGGATAAEVAAIAAQVAAVSGALGSTAKTHIATGTTAQRDAVPAEGDFRRNTTTARWEGYNNAAAWENVVTNTNLLTDWRAVIPATVGSQYLTSGTSATYTTPSNPTPRFLKVRMIGGGGGGGAATTNAGVSGTATSFSTFAANGGGGGAVSFGAGGSGGTGGSGGAGSLRLKGSAGCAAQNGADASVAGSTGATGLYGMGAGLGTTTTGGAGGVNTGAGGAGGGGSNTGAGGGSGEYCEFFISSPAATYTYTVGPGGAGGAAGGQAGGAGGSGVIIVEEIY